MSILDVTEFQPVPVMGARRVRMAMSSAVQQVEQALQQVNEVMEQHGRKVIAAELGEADDADLIAKFAEMQAFVAKYSRTVPDLKPRVK